MSSKIKTLFALFQKTDYRDKENSAKKKLTGVLLSFLFANTILSYNYYVTFDEKSFIILAYTSNLFLLALIVLTDFENLVLASRTSAYLETLPVKTSDIFKAKFYSTLLYLLFFILSTAIPQLVFYYLISESFYKTVVFLLSDILFCYFASGILILIYVIALRYFKKKASIILNLLQLSFFIFIFYSSTLSSKAASRPKGSIEKLNITDNELVNILPQTIFANSTENVMFFIGNILMSAGLLYTVYYIIAGNYSVINENVKELSSGRDKTLDRKKGKLSQMIFAKLRTFVNKVILKNNYETASFYLVKNMLQNSRFLVVKYMPLIVMPLMFVIIGLVTDAPHLLFLKTDPVSSSIFNTALLIVSPSITFVLVMCSRLLISGTKILDENSTDTKWIYDSMPIREVRSVNKGVSKFIYTTVLFPVIVVITILLSFKADFMNVFYNMIFISSGIYLINSVMLLFDKTYPFTLESTKFNSASKFFEVFFSMFLGLALFLIQIFVFQNIIFVIISVIIFSSISFLLNRN